MTVPRVWLRTVFLLCVLCVLAACAAREAPATKAEPSTAVLVGTFWILVSVGDETVPAESSETEVPFLMLQPQGQAVGFNAVNGFSGRYTSAGSSLEIQKIATTRRAGTPAAMKLEAAMMQALNDVRGYHIEGTSLELWGADGTTLARFRARPDR